MQIDTHRTAPCQLGQVNLLAQGKVGREGLQDAEPLGLRQHWHLQLMRKCRLHIGGQVLDTACGGHHHERRAPADRDMGKA